MPQSINGKGYKWSWPIMLICILGTYLLYSCVGVMSKTASNCEILSTGFIFSVGGIFVCMGIYAIIYQQLIKRVTLSTVYSLKGVVVIYNLFWAAVIFKEEITLFNVIGSLLILAGIYLVGKDD